MKRTLHHSEEAQIKRQETEASRTIYIQDIDDTVDIAVTRECLYLVFSKYGRILAINICKSCRKLRHAFIAYLDPEQANRALEMSGQEFLGRKIEARLAFKESNRVQL